MILHGKARHWSVQESSLGLDDEVARLILHFVAEHLAFLCSNACKRLETASADWEVGRSRQLVVVEHAKLCWEVASESYLHGRSQLVVPDENVLQVADVAEVVVNTGAAKSKMSLTLVSLTLAAVEIFEYLQILRALVFFIMWVVEHVEFINQVELDWTQFLDLKLHCLLPSASCHLVQASHLHKLHKLFVLE